MSDRSSPLSDVPKDTESPAQVKANTKNPTELQGNPNVKTEHSEDEKRVRIKTEVDETPVSKSKSKSKAAVERPGTPESSVETPTSTSPVTPKTPRSAKRAATPDMDGVPYPKKTKGRASPKPATPVRQRKAPTKTPSSGRAIASTMGDLSAEDRLLLNMKDKGKSWKEINEAWEAATGVKPAKSTLPNRYARLRANITSMSEADQQNLVRAKSLVEEAYEAEKWNQIAQKMQELGTSEKYSATVLQKQLSKMEVSNAQPAENPFEDVEE